MIRFAGCADPASLCIPGLCDACRRDIRTNVYSPKPSRWPVSACTVVCSPLTSLFAALACPLCCVCRSHQAVPRLLRCVCACHSAALVAYGLESFVDLWASVLVLWRFWEDEDTEAGMRKNHDREARADVGIAFTVSSRPVMMHWPGLRRSGRLPCTPGQGVRTACTSSAMGAPGADDVVTRHAWWPGCP
jgi:hypothetical protein